MENWKKRLERFHNGIIKSGECRAEQEGFLCCLEDEGVIDFISQELDRAREEGFADGVELEQLLNAEFFGEDYQNPKRLKELKKKYNFEDNK